MSASRQLNFSRERSDYSFNQIYYVSYQLSPLFSLSFLIRFSCFSPSFGSRAVPLFVIKIEFPYVKGTKKRDRLVSRSPYIHRNRIDPSDRRSRISVAVYSTRKFPSNTIMREWSSLAPYRILPLFRGSECNTSKTVCEYNVNTCEALRKFSQKLLRLLKGRHA
jgi:hypothetical protein